MKKISAKIFLLALAIGVNQHVSAQMSSWAHKKSFKITEVSGNNLSNYQLPISINTQALIAANELNADGSDLRFSTNCLGNTLLSYWIESGLNTPNTTIWVKINHINAMDDLELFMFYGNPIAPAQSSIPATFVGNFPGIAYGADTASGGVTNSQRGYRFSPNEPILVTDFAKYEPNGSIREVNLFDFNSQNILRSENVSGPAAQFSSQSLSSPIWLTQGTEYIISMYNGSTDGYYFGNLGQSSPHITYLEMRYCNGCMSTTMPTTTVANMHYGLVDFLYYTRNHPNVTAPLVVELPNFQAQILGAAVHCSNDSLLLEAQAIGGVAPYFYAWTSTGTFSGNATDQIIWDKSSQQADYSLTITDAAGCSSTVSATVPIHTALLIDAGEDLGACQGSMVTLNASGSDNITWSGGVQNGVAFEAQQSQTYYAYGLDLNGCVSEDSLFLSVYDCTDLDKLQAHNLHIYPNPAQSTLTIQGIESQMENILLLDASGKTLEQKSITHTGEMKWDISNLAEGLYYFRINWKNGAAYTIQVIKK